MPSSALWAFHCKKGFLSKTFLLAFLRVFSTHAPQSPRAACTWQRYTPGTREEAVGDRAPSDFKHKYLNSVFSVLHEQAGAGWECEEGVCWRTLVKPAFRMSSHLGHPGSPAPFHLCLQTKTGLGRGTLTVQSRISICAYGNSRRPGLMYFCFSGKKGRCYFDLIHCRLDTGGAWLEAGGAVDALKGLEAAASLLGAEDSSSVAGRLPLCAPWPCNSLDSCFRKML